MLVLRTCQGVLNAHMGTLSTTAQKGLGGAAGGAAAAAGALGWRQNSPPVDSKAVSVSLREACEAVLQRLVRGVMEQPAASAG